MDKTSNPTGTVSDDAVRGCLPSFNERELPAFAKIYKLYYDIAWNYLSRRVYDHASKEDILQDSFVDVWLSKKKFKTPLDLKKYLFSILHNNYADHVKRVKKQRPISHDNNPSDTSSDKKLLQADDQLRHRFIRKIIDGFSKVKRSVIVGTYFEEKSDQEIAAENGIDTNRVRSERFKALRKLEERLNQGF